MIDRVRRLLGRQSQPVTPPVRYLPLVEGPAAASSSAFDSEPRPLTAAELGGENCPLSYCNLPASSGTQQWRDRGPHQLLMCRTYRCPDGHGWIYETDGG